MAQALLLRTEADEIFQSKRLEFREPGFSRDLEKFYMGGLTENIHIPSEKFVGDMIKAALAENGPKFATTAILEETHVAGTFAFNTDTNRLLLKVGDAPVAIALKAEIPGTDQIAIKVAAANIDISDGSVLLENFNRPVRMIFVDGILCSSEGTATKRYTYDSVAKKAFVFGCIDGSVISYF